MSDQNRDVVVVGGGIAGMTVACAVADLGRSVTLLERDRQLGGHAAEWACMATDECAKCSACLVQDQIARTHAHPLIQVILGAEIAGFEGQQPDFRLSLTPCPPEGNGRISRPDQLLRGKIGIRCGRIVLATGFEPYDPAENPLLGYEREPGVLTTRDLDRMLRTDSLSDFLPEGDKPQRIAFIQCVGSRDKRTGREYCSQFCCRTTIRLVQRLRHLAPSVEATVFYIDLQVMSKEFITFFERARKDIRFIQGVPAEINQGEQEGSLRVYSITPGSDRTEALDFDRVVLAVGLAPTLAHQSLSKLFGLELNPFGYFAASADSPVESGVAGIYLAGACAGPSDIQGSRKLALAVAGRVAGTGPRPKTPSRTTKRSANP